MKIFIMQWKKHLTMQYVSPDYLYNEFKLNLINAKSLTILWL